MKQKKHKKIHLEFKYIVLIITFILSFTFIFTVYSIKTNRQLNVVERVIKDSVLTIGNIIYIPIDFCKDKIDYFYELNDIKKKYDDIKEDEDKILSYKQEIKNLKDEVKTLKEMLDIQDIKSLYSFKNATVISRNYTSWYNNLSINIGKKKGIKENMPVLKNGVLIGKIVNVSNNTSVVELLTTNTLENKISVSILTNEEKLYGLLVGYDSKDNSYIVEGISESAKINKGDIVVTSGLSDEFPSGILVGEVKEVRKDSYDLTRIVEVLPLVDFNDISYVSILIGEEK